MTSLKVILLGIIALVGLVSLASSNNVGEGRKKTSITNNAEVGASSALSNDGLKVYPIPPPAPFTFRVPMINNGGDSVKVSQHISVPDGVEITFFNLDHSPDSNATRQRRNARQGTLWQQELPQVVGGIYKIQAGQTVDTEMRYINHPEQITTENSKIFHNLVTIITVLGNNVVGGDISTPNYPENYPNGAEISWLITYPEGNTIRLDILDYSTEECCDHVIVYDGTNKSAPILSILEGEFSGYTSIITSTGPSIFIRFTSDGLISARGVQASYVNTPPSPSDPQTPIPTAMPPVDGTVVVSTTASTYFDPQCDENTSLYANGYINSPGYNFPSYYPQDADCQWRIQAYGNTDFIRFSIQYFSLEYYSDWLRIYDGNGTSNSQLLAELTGYISTNIDVATSTGRFATLHFQSDSNGTDRGFSIHAYSENHPTSHDETTLSPEVTTVSEPDNTCSGITHVTGYSGYISSPGYPNYFYANNLDCQYTIKTSEGTTVRMTIQYFVMASGDWLDIYDGYTIISPLLAHLEGYVTTGHSYDSSTNLALLHFVTDSYSTYPGFNIRYETIEDDLSYATEAPTAPTVPIFPECTNRRFLNKGVITSPNYPYAYDDSLDCVWIVYFAPQSCVLFHVDSFSTETCCDYANIFDGTPVNPGQMLAHLEGYNSYDGSEILSHRNTAFLTFYTDASVKAKGFSIRYEPVSCDYVPRHAFHTERKENSDVVGQALWKGAKNRPEKKPTSYKPKP